MTIDLVDSANPHLETWCTLINEPNVYFISFDQNGSMLSIRMKDWLLVGNKNAVEEGFLQRRDMARPLQILLLYQNYIIDATENEVGFWQRFTDSTPTDSGVQ